METSNKISNPRELALLLMLDLKAKGGRARNILNRIIRNENLNELDTSLLTEIVYGAIRWRGTLDWFIDQYVNKRRLRKIRRSKARNVASIIEILRIGIYQMLFLDSIPHHAAVNESVELAKIYGYDGSHGLVNAVLRRISREIDNLKYPPIDTYPVNHISVKYSHPKWLVKRWVNRYGTDEAIKICSANNRRPPIYMRVNMLRTTRDQLIQFLKDDGVDAVPDPNLSEAVEILSLKKRVSDLSAFKEGWFQIQDKSFMLVSHILNPKPGEKVIDVCAAPGGKTTHMAELMKNQGDITAFDNDRERFPLIKESIDRLGINIVKTIEADARDLDKHLSGMQIDRCLVDVPCSGLGVLRRRVETRWRISPEYLGMFPPLQYEILSSAAGYIKSGGKVLYCTCTTEPEENQNVVERFLNSHPDFVLDIPDEISAIGFSDMLTQEGYIQALPHHHNMDGFFAARMIKKG
ncbi:16S rRNA (cytosine(967)-C(5))-methyltransferase RsmB [Candidatus Poribacteria bacterium]|nr:16S rRNA (cytosine(967)-C(5))-methyltransferase RsmB [Candidatus Poribacteria bacterium]